MRKNSQTISMVEYPIREAFERLSQKKNLSVSAHIRKLMIDELREHDLLPPEMALELLSS